MIVDNKPQNDQPSYMIQLDALRAFAVLGVLVHHCLPQELFLNSKLHWGPLGVRLFFVLSGFLITGILLRCRDLIDLEKQDTGFTLRRFYIRRFLRLIPVYYVTILATTIINFSSIKKSLFWHLTYTSNIYFSWNSWDTTTSHFWSLSVEEQFYLFWPLVILMLPRKYILSAIVLTIIIGPLFRILIMTVGLSDGNREYILTFACFDSLGIGALLGFLNYNKKQLRLAKKYIKWFCFLIGIPSFIAFNFMYIPTIDNSIVLSLGYTTASMFFFLLIDRAALGFSGLMGVILEWHPLVYLGKISYGIYLYHLLVYYIVDKIFTHTALPLFGFIWIKFITTTIITISISILSWELFEKPINALKRKFGYKKERLSS